MRKVAVSFEMEYLRHFFICQTVEIYQEISKISNKITDQEDL